MKSEDAIVLAAIAATAYSILTLLLLLEARSARVASTQAAMVVARLTFSRDNELDAVIRLQNFGPAVAEDIRLRMAFLTPREEVIVEHSVWVPAMAPGDDEPYLPSLLLPDQRRGTDAALAEIRDQGALLQLTWSVAKNPVPQARHSSSVAQGQHRDVSRQCDGRRTFPRA